VLSRAPNRTASDCGRQKPSMVTSYMPLVGLVESPATSAGFFWPQRDVLPLPPHAATIPLSAPGSLTVPQPRVVRQRVLSTPDRDRVRPGAWHNAAGASVRASSRAVPGRKRRRGPCCCRCWPIGSGYAGWACRRKRKTRSSSRLGGPRTPAHGTSRGWAWASTSSRRIIERHGGKLDVASPGDGQGTMFVLWVPGGSWVVGRGS